MTYSLLSAISLLILHIYTDAHEIKDTCRGEDYEYRFYQGKDCAFRHEFRKYSWSQCRESCDRSCTCTGFNYDHDHKEPCVLCAVHNLVSEFGGHYKNPKGKDNGFYAKYPKGRRISMMSTTDKIDDSWKTCDGKEYEYYNTTQGCNMEFGHILYLWMNLTACKARCSADCLCRSVQVDEHGTCTLRFYDCPRIKYSKPFGEKVVAEGYLLLRHEKGTKPPLPKLTCGNKKVEYVHKPGVACASFMPLDMSMGRKSGDGHYKTFDYCREMCSGMCECRAFMYKFDSWGRSYCETVPGTCDPAELVKSDSLYFIKTEV